MKKPSKNVHKLIINNWCTIDDIKRGKIDFIAGDEVMFFRRKSNGYPKGLNDDDFYIVRKKENDSLIVAKHSLDGVGFLQPIKVHKTYMISKRFLREIKINNILI
jgi:hypothetical protein